MEDAIWMNKAASARYIKENRTRLGITQVELADRVGVSRNVVYMWEAGNNMPCATNRKALESEFSKKFVKHASRQKQGKRNDLPKLIPTYFLDMMKCDRWCTLRKGCLKAFHHREAPSTLRRQHLMDAIWSF